jgi:hypothetical protein
MKRIITCPISAGGRKSRSQKPVRLTKKRVRKAILERVFPGGVVKAKIRKSFAFLFRGRHEENLSDEKLKDLAIRWAALGHNPKVRHLAHKFKAFEEQR